MDDTVALPPPTHTRRRDPNGNEETHYDDIRVSSAAYRLAKDLIGVQPPMIDLQADAEHDMRDAELSDDY